MKYVKPSTKLIKVEYASVIAVSPSDPAATRPEDSATKRNFMDTEEDGTAPQKSVWSD